MKNILVISTIVLVGLAFILNRPEAHKRETVRSYFKVSKANKKEAPVMTAVTVTAAKPAQKTEAPDMEEIEERYESMDIKDLEIELEKFESSEKQKELIALANKAQLTEEEKVELLAFIRTQAVLNKLVFEMKYDEFEAL